MAHRICRAIASEREFMVFVMVLVAAATFLAIGAIAACMSLVGPRPNSFTALDISGDRGNRKSPARPLIVEDDPERSSSRMSMRIKKCTGLNREHDEYRQRRLLYAILI
jgi:hypothetical protein